MGLLSGSSGAKAARRAAEIQAAAIDRATEFQKETRDLVRADLEEFKELGRGNIDNLNALVTDPQAQIDFLENNPFFSKLKEDSERSITKFAAAKSGAASGDTAEALQTSFLLLGNDLLQQQIGNVGGLVNIGQNSAVGQGNAALQTGATISDLAVQKGNVLAAGEVGAANSRQGAFNNLVNTGAGLAAAGILRLSDRRAKENIQEIGELYNGLSVYSYNYVGDDEMHMGVIAQEVKEMLPNAVVEVDGLLHVDYAQITNDVITEIH